MDKLQFTNHSCTHKKVFVYTVLIKLKAHLIWALACNNTGADVPTGHLCHTKNPVSDRQ